MISQCLLLGVRSCYDEGKRVAETLMYDYHRQHGIGKFLSLSLSQWGKKFRRTVCPDASSYCLKMVSRNKDC